MTPLTVPSRGIHPVGPVSPPHRASATASNATRIVRIASPRKVMASRVRGPVPPITRNVPVHVGASKA